MSEIERAKLEKAHKEQDEILRLAVLAGQELKQGKGYRSGKNYGTDGGYWYLITKDFPVWNPFYHPEQAELVQDG